MSQANPLRPARHPRLLGRARWLLDQSLNLYAALVLLYLMVPIIIIIVFSFNDPEGRFNFDWSGFTLDNWADPFGVPGLLDAMGKSIQIAVIATIVATILGTLMALALVRYRFRGRGATNFFVFLPLSTPEVVLGAALLSLFISVDTNTGMTTVILAHVMFSISLVVITVRSRLVGFDLTVEEAAQDLGANGIQTFRYVTLPLIAPAILAAALLVFALSLDDFVITNFNSGPVVTFPLFIWGAARVATPPQINVLATMIFLVTVAIMLFTVWQQRRVERAAARVV